MPRDPAEGERLLQRAVDLGMVPAYRPFVKLLEDQQRYDRARAVAEAGVQAGDGWLSGELARWAEEGRFGPRNFTDAYVLYQEAARFGSNPAVERRLGEMCRDGLGIVKDPQRGCFLVHSCSG